MKPILTLIVSLAVMTGCGANNHQSDRIHYLENMPYPAIDAIDREKSMVFLTFGNLEEHGPHIPIGSDIFQAVAVRDLLVARLQETYPDYDMVLLPPIPVGEGGANDMAHEFVHIGSFWFIAMARRFTTLRSTTRLPSSQITTTVRWSMSPA